MTYRTRILTVLTGVLVLFVMAVPVQAASFTAGTAQELIDAINDANNEITNPGVDTIILTDNITLSAVNNTLNGNNGLPGISSEIIIEGAGFTVRRSTESSTTDFRIVFISSGGNLTLNDITLRNGVSSTNTGGTIENAGTLTLRNSTVSNGRSLNGGGIFNLNGTVTLINSTISNNMVDSFGAGGGLANNNTMILENSMVVDNTSGGNGGGIRNDGRMILNNSVVSGNYAASAGGGIYNADALSASDELIINNSVISGNSTDDTGGGIFNFGRGIATLTNSTIFGNTAASGGGGIYNGELFDAATMTLTNSTISGNSSDSNGGGIHNGGIVSVDARMTLNNSTVSGNSAVNEGGGIYNLTSNEMILNNSIVANSTNQDYAGNGTLTSQGTNIVADGSIPGAMAVNPNITPLGDYGGPTPTHGLFSGSPAIDNSSSSITATDQRGAATVNTRDIGAFEFAGAIPAVSFTVDEPALTEGGAITQATVTITVRNYNTPFDIRFAFTGSTSNTDYTTTYNDLITISSNSTRMFTVDIVNDTLPEDLETLNLQALIVGTADVYGLHSRVIVFEDTITDVNNDGITSPADAVFVVNRLGTGATLADINGDNTVDMIDYNAVINALGTSVP